MKRALFVFLLVLSIILNIKVINSSLRGDRSVNTPYFELEDYSLTLSKPGIYEFNIKVKNTGDPTSTGTVPIHWAELYYELRFDDGIGSLKENDANYDINGDGDKDDTFDVAWNDSIRPWDATVDGNYVYALCDHSERWNLNRSYYINDKPKLFQLGSKSHILQRATNEYAWFALGASIKQHPSPNLELVIELNISATDFKVNGKSVKVDHSSVELFKPSDGTPYYASAFIIPNEASEIKAGEDVTVSCTLTSHEEKTVMMFLIVNWSIDGIRRYIWVPINGDKHTYEAYTSTDGITAGSTGFTLLLAFTSILMLRRKK
ncbi:MAG: hypothetical protein ACFFAE_13415 [Candidatus Hodarchaeota archaeon]